MAWFANRFGRMVCLLAVMVGAAWHHGFGQQVIQRGAFGKPGSVLDETNQWTTPLMMTSDKDVEIYIPDVSSPDWLRKNYDNYINHGFYTLTLFTRYRTPLACRANQTGWGLGDKEHLDACVDIGYRVRLAKIVPQEKSATLMQASMVLQNGEVDPDTIETRQTFRFWNQLDGNTKDALEKANGLVAAQMKIYDEKIQSQR